MIVFWRRLLSNLSNFYNDNDLVFTLRLYANDLSLILRFILGVYMVCGIFKVVILIQDLAGNCKTAAAVGSYEMKVARVVVILLR